jgi:hypothetical protein
MKVKYTPIQPKILYSWGMEHNRNTSEYRRLMMAKGTEATKAAEALGVSLPVLPPDPDVQDNHALPLSMVLEPSAESSAALDALLDQKKRKDQAILALQSIEGISPQRADELGKALPLNVLEDAVAHLKSDDPAIREQGREHLNLPSDPEDKKEAEENEKLKEDMLLGLIALETLNGPSSSPEPRSRLASLKADTALNAANLENAAPSLSGSGKKTPIEEALSVAPIILPAEPIF